MGCDASPTAAVIDSQSLKGAVKMMKWVRTPERR